MFEHVSDGVQPCMLVVPRHAASQVTSLLSLLLPPPAATRILREILLLRLLKHPDIVEIKHIMLPPSARDYRDIYVVRGAGFGAPSGLPGL